MLRKPSHYESTTPRLMQETLGKIVEAVNANTTARLVTEAAKPRKPRKPKKPKKGETKEKTHE